LIKLSQPETIEQITKIPGFSPDMFTFENLNKKISHEFLLKILKIESISDQ